MFEQSLVESKKAGLTRRPWTVALSFLLQCALIGVLALMPLFYTQGLPLEELKNAVLLAPPPPPPPPPPAAAPRPRVIAQHVEPRIDTHRLIAPTIIPKTINMAPARPAPPPPTPVAEVVGGVPGGIPGGQIGGVIGGVLASLPAPVMAPPPPPPPPAPAPAPQRIQVGGLVEAAKKIGGPLPTYPPAAEAKQIQGTVRLAAVIGKNGTISELHVVSGPPELQQAALEAVKQWRYQPTFLNGQAAEVATVIDVNFKLT